MDDEVLEPPSSWPFRTIIAQEVLFGRRGNAGACQAYGWSLPEDGYTWTLGTRSALILDKPDAPFGFFLEMEMGALLCPINLPRQKLNVRVNGRDIHQIEIHHPVPVSIFCPASLLDGPRLVVEIYCPNAARASDLFGLLDDRELAFSFFRLRVLALTEAFSRPSEMLSNRILASDIQSAIQDGCEITQTTPADLLTRFEMLSGLCEMGIVQRVLGVEPLSLLRFAGASLRVAIRALDEKFVNVGQVLRASPDPAGTEWMISDEFGLYYHTGMSVAAVDRDRVLESERQKISFLRRKILEDLASPRKIFVFADRDGLPIEAALSLFLALRRYGPHTMLWARPAGPQNRGMVKEIIPGLLSGGLEKMTPPLVGPHPVGGWLALFVNAWLCVPPPVAAGPGS